MEHEPEEAGIDITPECENLSTTASHTTRINATIDHT